MTTTEPRTSVPAQSQPNDSRAAADRYIAAWNAHDGAAVAALVGGGTYHDPTLPEPIAGEDLAAYVDGLCAAFPDLHFDHDGDAIVDGGRVVAPWRMRGTNDGAPLPGAPAATNGTVDLAGVDVITVDGDTVSVQGYFDQKAFIEQLGLQAIVAPKDEWPVSFGLASRLDLGNTTVPGAMTMTWITIDGAESGELVERTREILTALAGEPGFVAFQSTSVGSRYLTLTAWTSPEAAESALARIRPHVQAMERVLEGGFSSGGFTSLWAPYRVNPQYARCGSCQRYVAFAAGETTATCECGSEQSVQPYL